jgi:hypothetical protein
VDPELQRVIAYWLDHPVRVVVFYMLAAFVGGFARAAARDAARSFKRRRNNGT